MHYFFIEGFPLAAGREVELSPGDVNYAYRVLRLRKGSAVVLADGQGSAFHGLIISIGPASVRISLIEPAPAAESGLRITLVQALAKGEKMDLVVRQAVELGVARVIPVVTERSIPNWNAAREKSRQQRWRSIVRSAAAQCRRARLPVVAPVHDFREALTEIPGHKALVPWEGEQVYGVRNIFEQPFPAEGAALVFIGPEGGFSAREIEALIQAGAQPVHLGPRILRTETAAAITLGLVQAAWGDLGAAYT